MTTWLDGARSTPRGLLIPGGPRDHSADLLLGVEVVEVTHGAARVTLPWSGYAKNRRFGRDDSWSLGFWGDGPQGIGVDGPHALDPLRDSTMSLRNRFAGWNSYNKYVHEYPVVPLWAGQFEWIWISSQWYEFSMLLQLLHDRAALRPTLLDAARTTRLAHDLASGSALGGASGLYMTGGAGAIVQALNGLGYRFRYGRPLPGDQRDSLAVVLEKVMHRLDSNPWHNATVTSERATKVIRQYYVDVEPWPFAALGV